MVRSKSTAARVAIVSSVPALHLHAPHAPFAGIAGEFGILIDGDHHTANNVGHFDAATGHRSGTFTSEGVVKGGGGGGSSGIEREGGGSRWRDRVGGSATVRERG